MRHRRPRWVLGGTFIALISSSAPPLTAQYLGGGTRTAHEARLVDLEAMRDKLLDLGHALPSETFDWRPMEGVRSAREVFALVAAQASLFPTVWGYDLPAWTPDPGIDAELRRLNAVPPEQLLREVERSFAHLLTLLDGRNDEELTRIVDFFGVRVPLGAAVTLMANDMHEHLGQLVAYARVNHVVPPWSRASADRAVAGDLFVADLQTSSVSWFDGEAGHYRGPFVDAGYGGLDGATGLAFGPDGDLYVSSSRTDQILRYDGTTGESRGVFIDGGSLRQPFSLVFGPDGDLYVSSGVDHRVLRYDGRDGSPVGVAAEGGGLRQPIGLAFGPHDGLLYVVSSVGRSVVRFDPETARSRGVFATDSLRFPSDLTFGPDGDLYVTSATSATVVRLDGRTGAFVETYVRLPGQGGAAVGLAFLPDGSLAVGDFGRGRLYMVDPRGGRLRLASDEGLARPENIAVKPSMARDGR